MANVEAWGRGCGGLGAAALGRLGGARGQLAEGGLGGRAGRGAVGDQALAGVGDGRLDILVNNAGIARGNPASETNLDTMREVYEVNVFGAIRVTNAMLPLLRRAPAARIVNVSSEVGSISSMTDPASPLAQMPTSLAYPSSKAALNMITALYAKDLRDTPIKVNAANPGYTKTDLNRNSGFRSVTEGAEAGVYLATLGADGPSGVLWGHLWSADGPADAYGRLPW